MKGHVLAIVPAFNEEEAVGTVIDEIKRQPGVDVLVVSDGSRDATVHEARSHDAWVIELPHNLGVGGAMRTGYRWAVTNGYSITVQVDADGQHDPADIPRLVEALDHCDVVIGARFAGKGAYKVRGPRSWAMSLLSGVLRMITGKKFSDTTSGFRAAGKAGTEFFAANYPAEYLGDTVETLVMAARAGLNLGQVAVEMRVRQGGVPSQRPWKLVTSMFRVCLAIALALVRTPYPRKVTRWQVDAEKRDNQ